MAFASNSVLLFSEDDDWTEFPTRKLNSTQLKILGRMKTHEVQKQKRFERICQHHPRTTKHELERGQLTKIKTNTYATSNGRTEAARLDELEYNT